MFLYHEPTVVPKSDDSAVGRGIQNSPCEAFVL